MFFNSLHSTRDGRIANTDIQSHRRVACHHRPDISRPCGSLGWTLRDGSCKNEEAMEREAREKENAKVGGRGEVENDASIEESLMGDECTKKSWNCGSWRKLLNKGPHRGRRGTKSRSASHLPVTHSQLLGARNPSSSVIVFKPR